MKLKIQPRLFIAPLIILALSCTPVKQGKTLIRVDSDPTTNPKPKQEISVHILPCAKAPAGMVCIPGGKSYVGAHPKDKEARPNEQPQIELFVQTFYMDQYEVTNAEFDECVKTGACTKWYNINHPMYKDYRKPKQPATPITWYQARDFCRWKGKRLPSEAEWEKVARGGEKNTIYPWGDEAPSCDKASYEECNLYGLKRRSEDYKDIYPTKEVGSYPPGHYGVYDMAGNGYEWVNDWYTPCRTGCGEKSCGKSCLGENPKGPCDGRYPCPGFQTKILKGGSWWWTKSQMRASWRREEVMRTGGHRLSFRCAADSPQLTNAPAWMIANPIPEPPAPQPPSKEELAIFESLENDTMDKPICKHKYTSPAHCKDPVSYVQSNEYRTPLFAPYVRNLGGGYIGIAADANYSFVALAKSRWVWLMDFDKNIVNLHRMIKAFVLTSKTPLEFAEYFNPRNAAKTLVFIDKTFPHYDQLELMKTVYRRYHAELYPYYLYQTKARPDITEFGWLRYQKNYDYIRLLFQQGRITIQPGDLLKNKTLRSIGNAAKKLGTVIRIYYPSNAEEFWKYNENYKQNILNLPFDDASVALRTVHEYPWHPAYHRKRGYAGFWHYVVHGALNYQNRMKLEGYYLMHHWRHERILPTTERDFSTIHLPNHLNEGTPPSFLK